MSEKLTAVAKELRSSEKKVQLIYAFNGTGKTRLSQAFKSLFDVGRGDEDEQTEATVDPKILYYSAFTEDLFYWDNESGSDGPKLKIQPNSFTDWILLEQGQDRNVITTFQRYTNNKLTPRFNAARQGNLPRAFGENASPTIKAFSEVTFSIESGDDSKSTNLKISKGEESNFIWSLFYALLELVVETRAEVKPDFPTPTPFDKLEYVFIDDPVSSLDDNHVIQVAVDIAEIIKSNKSDISFIITTHNPLFFNILCNEFGRDHKNHRYNWHCRWFSKWRLEKSDDGKLDLKGQVNDSPFAYHLYLILQLQEAIKTGQVEKYHFSLLRNVLEKTATFLGYSRWEQILSKTVDGSPNPVAKRIMDFSSHSKHAAEEVSQLTPELKEVLARLVNELVEHYRFFQPGTEEK